MKNLILLSLILVAFFSCTETIIIEDPEYKETGISVLVFSESAINLEGPVGEIDFVLKGSKILVKDPAAIETAFFVGPVLIDMDTLFERAPNLKELFAGYGTFVTGSLKTFPSSVTSINVSEGAAIGTVTLPDGLETFRMNNGNEIALNIETLPESLSLICLNQGNKVFGDIGETLPQGMDRIVILGENEIGGDYGLIKGEFPATFAIGGNNTITSFSSGKANFSTMRQFIHNANYQGLDSDSIDNLLIELSGANWAGLKKLYLGGQHGKRTTKSDAAVQVLLSKGVDLFVK